MARRIKVAYIGGGSKEWAGVFINDLTLDGALCGELALYDIDIAAAERNARIGARKNALPEARAQWDYAVYAELAGALRGADFVVLSILPGDFEDMRSDVHTPEAYGIYQSVGDTTGPGGILRAMRTVPLYEEFARAIEAHCPHAWVINLTNPMSACVKALYDTFPGIKAFGCCHEVFHAQDFLCRVLTEVHGVPQPARQEIFTDVAGVNHFTWITQANWQGEDLLALLPAFSEKVGAHGLLINHSANERTLGYFADRGLVKLDLMRRYGALGAAGDRHLAEFVNGAWYLKSPDHAAQWGFMLTDVDYRVAKRARQIEQLAQQADGRVPVTLTKSKEELVDLMKAILGLGTVVSNVNLPNRGQMADLPTGSVVETNCVFATDSVTPVTAAALTPAAAQLVRRACTGIDVTCDGIIARDADMIFSAFADNPLCARLDLAQARELFATMTQRTKARLEPYVPSIFH